MNTLVIAFDLSSSCISTAFIGHRKKEPPYTKDLVLYLFCGLQCTGRIGQGYLGGLSSHFTERIFYREESSHVTERILLAA